MSSFFRRLRRDKEEPPTAPVTRKKETEEEDEDEVTPKDAVTRKQEPAVPADRHARDAPLPPESVQTSRDVDAPPAKTSRLPPGPAANPIPAGPPPPLPEADAEAAPPTSRPRSGSRHCFICGTEMDGPWCPTCRMVWND